MEVQRSVFSGSPSEFVLSDISQYDAQEAKLTKPEKVQVLSKLFKEVTNIPFRSQKEINSIAIIISRYGKVLYDKAQRDVAKRAYSIAFTLLAFRGAGSPKLGFTDTHFQQVFNSPTLEETVSPDKVPDDFEHALWTVDTKWLQKESHAFSPEDQFEVASALRWLEHCHQNLQSYQTPAHDGLFEKTVCLAEAVLEGLLKQNLSNEQRTKVENERFELDYNTSHYLYRRKHPGDVDGMLAMLKELLERYNHDPQKQSRICNLLACFTPADRLQEVYENAKVAHSIKQNYPDRFEPFLHAVGKSNFVAACLKFQGREESLEALQKLMDEAVEYVKQETAQGNFNDYFPSIWLKEARLMQAMQNIPAALSACNEARAVYDKCPDPDVDDLAEWLSIKNSLSLVNSK